MAVFIEERVLRSLEKKLDRGALTQVHKHLARLAEDLDEDPTRGDHISLKLVPDSFSGLRNLWRAELPGAWRALYTIAGYPSRDLRVVIVWVGDHKAYDRLFGYR